MSFVADLDALVAASTNGLHACPPGWQRVSLGSVAKIINGYPFASGHFGSAGAPVIRIRDVVRGRSETNYAGPIPEGYWVEQGDLIVGMDGDFATALWRSDPALLNQRVCKIVADPAKVELRYLRYCLPGYLDLVNENTPSVTVKHLSSRTLAAIPLPLPTLKTQRAIVSQIDALFAEVENGEAALALARADLGTWRKALLKAAVTGDLTADWRVKRMKAEGPPPESGTDLLARILTERRTRWHAEPRNKRKQYVEPTGPDTASLQELPEGWAWATLDSLLSPDPNSLADGPFGSNLKSEHYQQTGPRVLRLQNIGRFGDFNDAKAHISQDHFDSLRRHHVDAGDLIIAILGGPLPRAVIVPPSCGPALVKADCLKLRVHNLMSNHFAWAWLNSMPLQGMFRDQIHGVGRPRLGMAAIRSMPVPVPAAAEQAKIIEVLERALEERESTDDSIIEHTDAAATLRQSILAAAFRGALTA